MNTDAYQPIEKEWKLTRQLLEIMLEYRHPVSLLTKSALILRDIDLLSELARQNLCTVHISVTSIDNKLKASLEPRAAGPAARLRVIRELSAAGVPTGILAAPIIPFINDHEMEEILTAAKDAGAHAANWILVRLPQEVEGLFNDWLQTYYPERAERVLNRLRDMRNGNVAENRFGYRKSGEGVYAKLLSQRFSLKCRELGIATSDHTVLRTDLFRRPGEGEQMSLL